MPSLTIRHVTTYRYRQPVAFGEHRMMLRPRDSHDQKVIEATSRDQPGAEPACASSRTPSATTWRSRNSTAARRNCASRASSASSIRPPTQPTSPCGKPPAPFPSTTAPTRCRTSLTASSVTIPIRTTRSGAGPASSCRRAAPSNVLELLVRLSQGIHRGFAYRRREAKGIQQPLETLRLGQGSCRDFALLMIEAARALGLAARFASGYLAVPLEPARNPRAARPLTGLMAPPMRGRRSTCRAPAGSISIRPAAASARPLSSPSRSCGIRTRRFRCTAPSWGPPSDPLGMEVHVSVTSIPPHH